MSALALLAGNENRWLKITPDDTVILSSHPIPGNEHAVTKVIDNLVRLGAEVVHSGIEDVHATGHAKEEDLKLFLSVARPEWFVPVHGEYRHLVAHARLAKLMGVAARSRGRGRGRRPARPRRRRRSGSRGRVPADYVYVHGTIGDVGTSTLGERRILGDEGVVAAIVCVDVATRTPRRAARWSPPAAGSSVTTRPSWSAAVTERVKASVTTLLSGNDKVDVSSIERTVRRAAGSTVNDVTRRRPMIVPVVLEA